MIRNAHKVRFATNQAPILDEPPVGMTGVLRTRKVADSVPIHLFTPSEHVSTQVRNYVQPPWSIHLSHGSDPDGTLVRRSQVEEFLTLLKECDLNKEEIRMPDKRWDTNNLV